jgi:hypothetical protein
MPTFRSSKALNNFDFQVLRYSITVINIQLTSTPLDRFSPDASGAEQTATNNAMFIQPHSMGFPSLSALPVFALTSS